MQILTPSGYKDASLLSIGDEVLAYDMITGEEIINTIEKIEAWDDEHDIDNQGAFTFYLINGTIKLYKNQSVWANGNVTHAKLLQVGDEIYDDEDNAITVDSIEETTNDIFYRFEISGDHSYITPGITLHNASRFWVGGGSGVTWVAVGNTNWSATSGGANNATVPTSTDDVTFNSSGNSASTIANSNTILSLTIASGYTATMTHNALTTIAGNWSFATGYTIAGTSGVSISAAATITSGGKTFPNVVTFTGANTKTISGALVIGGALTIGAATVINGSAISIAGFTVTAVVSGTSDITLTGGTWSGNFTVTNNIFFAGSSSISGTVNYSTGTLKYSSGTITTAGSTISLTGACTLDTAGMVWNIVVNSFTATYTCASLLTANQITQQLGISPTWTGAAGWTCATYLNSVTTTASTCTLKAGNGYAITAAFNSFQARAAAATSFVSSDATLTAALTLSPGATCNCNSGFTRIDASAGRTIWTFNGALTGNVNIKEFHDMPTMGSAY